MTTLATGGFFQPHGFGGSFNNSIVEILVIAGMIGGGLCHYLAMTRGGWKNLIEDPQVRWFAAIIATVSLLATFSLCPALT